MLWLILNGIESRHFARLDGLVGIDPVNPHGIER